VSKFVCLAVITNILAATSNVSIVTSKKLAMSAKIVYTISINALAATAIFSVRLYIVPVLHFVFKIDL